MKCLIGDDTFFSKLGEVVTNSQGIYEFRKHGFKFMSYCYFLVLVIVGSWLFCLFVLFLVYGYYFVVNSSFSFFLS